MKKNTRNKQIKSSEGGKARVKWFIIIFLCLVLACVGVLLAYNILWKSNINTASGKYKKLYVPYGSTWVDVKDSLNAQGLIKNEREFDNALALFGKNKEPQCGFYSLEPNISNRAFINRVSYGLSNKLPLEVKMTRYTRWVARNISRQLDVDSATLYNAFTSDTVMHRFGVNKESSLAMFVRFKRDVSWCSDASDVMRVVEEEYHKFWDGERTAKCNEIGLTPVKVTILASIVEEETNDYDDRRMVAGVYMNRIRKGMPLQSCPTVRYAWGDFSINRVLKAHLEIDSPYNTYKYSGFPPGPIRIPSANSIDAVLNYEHHNYYYMCAKSDFSGTHDYATTFLQHSQNARKYQRELNKKGIR